MTATTLLLSILLLLVLAACALLLRRLAVLQSAADARQAHELTAAPIGESLQRMHEEIRRLEIERAESGASLRELVEHQRREIATLADRTGALTSALKRPEVRGSWGEIGLENVVRIAGMTEHVDFETQMTLRQGSGEHGEPTLRPDMVVRLPTGRQIVVDAKVPLDAYLLAIECSDERERDALLGRHAAQLRKQVDRLAGKAYHGRLDGSAEFVVCFVPNEACYVAALDRDPGLIEHGAQRGVLLATPTTLLALLHATHYGWRHVQIERSAEQIAEAARELHSRCATFATAYETLGRRLASTVDAYNKSVGSFDARVLPQLRRIEQLGAKSGKQITAPETLDQAPRAIASGA